MNWPLLFAMAMILVPAIALAIWVTWYYRDILFDKKSR